MAENGIIAKIREIVQEQLKVEFEALVGPKLDKQVDARVDELVPVALEHALDKQGPLMVAAELHKVLTGEPKKHAAPAEDEDPTGESAEDLHPTKPRGGGPKAKGKKLGKRPRCPKCGSAMAKAGCRKCKKR